MPADAAANTHTPPHLSAAITEAIAALHAGEIIAYPTEAVYGLGCDPHNIQSLHRLHALKQRPQDKGLIIVAADASQLVPFVLQPQQLAQLTPGTTWIVDGLPTLAPALTGANGHTLAVRISTHPIICALCSGYAGAIVSTSANPSGMPPARTAEAVRAYFDQRLAVIICGALGELQQPTPIVDARTGQRLR